MGIALTRRAGVNGVEVLKSHGRAQSITPNEPKWIPRLRLNVDPNNLSEARAVVAHRRPASPAEQVQQPHGFTANISVRTPWRRAH